MFGIGDLFKRVQNIYAKEALTRSLVQQAIKKYTGVEIALDCISLDARQVSLKKVGSAVNSVIFIKKPLILRDIQANESLKHITDIR